MKLPIVEPGSPDPYTSNTLCFLCSNNQISLHYSNTYLINNGIQNSDNEKRKIIAIVCQLLRVKWDTVEGLFVQEFDFPFCEYCLKSVIDMIELREQLFLIESDIREKIKQIESSIAKSYKPQESVDQSEWKKRKAKYSHSGYRQSFQMEVMNEYWNKELLREKIEELTTIQKSFVEVNLSLIQLHMEKNIFSRDGIDDMLPDGVVERVIYELDEDIKISQDCLDISEMCGTTIDDKNCQQFEYNFKLVSSTNENGFEGENLQNGHACESSLPTLRFTDGESGVSSNFMQAIETGYKFPGVCNVNETVDSDDSRNDPDYKPQSKKSRLFKTPKSGGNTRKPATPNHGPPTPQMSNYSFVRRCDCGATDANFILSCKLCGKLVQRTQKKFQPNTKKNKTIACPFCQEKFADIKLLKEHASSIHLPSGPMKIIHERMEDYHEFGLVKEEVYTIDNIDTSIYDPEELVESLSEHETKPIISSISSGESESEENKKVETFGKLLPFIRTTRASRKNDTSTVKKSLEVTNTAKCARRLSDVNEFIANDKTIWRTIVTPKTKIKKLNILRQDGKLLGKAADPSLTPAELFKFMISPDIVDRIVRYTNIFAESVLSKDTSHDTKIYQEINSPMCPFKPTTEDEIYAFIGIVLYFGLERKSKMSNSEAWISNGKNSIPCIAATMSRERFQFLNQFLCFNDQIARRKAFAQGIIPEKLSYISEIFDPFIENIGTYLKPYGNLVVDEMLINFRGTTTFREYMKSKPGRYGVKIWACCDTKTGYILRLVINESKQSGKAEAEVGRKIVLDLVKNYFGTGRNVTTDHFFTSKALAHDLKKQNMSLLGTLNKTRKDVISEFANGRGRKVESSTFAFQNDLTMVSYIPRKDKSVVLLSTQHHSADINPEIRNKPQMILDYNKTKGAVDTAEQMIGNSSCQRTTRRWPMKIFFAMCDIGALNAYHIWKIHQRNTNKNPARFNFLRMLSETLMEPMSKARLQNGTSLSTNTKLAMQMMRYPVVQLGSPVDNMDDRTGRCMMCKGVARKSTRNNCRSCKKWICKDHMALAGLCVNCNQFTVEKNAKCTSKRPRIMEVIEQTSGHTFDHDPDIISTTPVKWRVTEQNQQHQSPQPVDRMGLRTSARKIEQHRIESQKAPTSEQVMDKSKCIPMELIYEMDTQEIQPINSLQVVPQTNNHTLETAQFPSSNFYLPENDSPRIVFLESDLATNGFFNPMTAPSHQVSLSSELFVPTQTKLRSSPRNGISRTKIGQSNQVALYPSNTQVNNTGIFSPNSVQFVQPEYAMTSVNVMKSHSIVTNQMQSSYILTAANNPYQNLMMNRNVVFKQNSSSSLPVRKTLKMGTSVPIDKRKTLKNVQLKDQLNYSTLVETVDISDCIDETQKIPLGNGVRRMYNLRSLQSDDRIQSPFDDYNLR